MAAVPCELCCGVYACIGVVDWVEGVFLPRRLASGSLETAGAERPSAAPRVGYRLAIGIRGKGEVAAAGAIARAEGTSCAPRMEVMATSIEGK